MGLKSGIRIQPRGEDWRLGDSVLSDSGFAGTWKWARDDQAVSRNDCLVLNRDQISSMKGMLEESGSLFVKDDGVSADTVLMTVQSGEFVLFRYPDAERGFEEIENTKGGTEGSYAIDADTGQLNQKLIE